jgi:8-amino-3,8-dideoxy-alpha-D-manno-octulosonate transaminase
MHVYSNIHSLVGKHSNSPDGFPWTLEANRESVYDYARGALPRSDHLMDRSIILPIPSVMTRRDINDTIRGIRKVAASLL